MYCLLKELFCLNIKQEISTFAKYTPVNANNTQYLVKTEKGMVNVSY